MGRCRDYCNNINGYVCCFECLKYKECTDRSHEYICYGIFNGCNQANYHTCKKYVGEESTINSNSENNNNKITVYVYGDPESEHTTKVCNNNKEAKFYCDWWNGTTYKQICNLLDVIGVEYFTVIKKRG